MLKTLLDWLVMPFTKRYNVTFVMRTGQIITLTFTKFDYKYQGGQVTSAEWTQNRLCGERLAFLDLGTVAGITIENW